MEWICCCGCGFVVVDVVGLVDGVGVMDVGGAEVDVGGVMPAESCTGS